MLTRIKSGLTALTVVIVMVVALDYVAAAATGRPMILGKKNKANHTTVLKMTGKGAALKLKSRADQPSLKVSSKKKVARLNADLLDNMDAQTFLQNRSRVTDWTTNGQTGGFTLTSPAIPPGDYLVTYSATLGGAGGTPANGNAVNCWVRQFYLSGVTPVNKRIVANSGVYATESNAQLSGAGALSLAAGDQVALTCSMSQERAWRTPPLQPIQLTLTRTDGFDYVAGVFRPQG